MNSAIIEALFPWIVIVLIGSLFIFGVAVIRWRRNYMELVKHNQLLEDEREQMESTFREIRTDRHDFLKHINALHYLLQSEQWEESQSYIEQLVESHESTNCSIKGEQGHIASFLYLTYQQGLASRVQISYDLKAPFSNAPLSAIDQSKLIGNLLSNSIEAASQFAKHHQNAYVTLSTSIKSGLYIIEISNSSLPIPNKILDSLFQSFGQTSKGEQHQGLGTYIISKIIKSNHGKIDYTYIRQSMTIEIKLPILDSF